MTGARRFIITIDSTVLHCCACESEQELDALLAGRPAISSGVNLSSAPGAERPRGRPSFAAIIGDAVQALQLDPTRPLAGRARAILRHLAETRDASEIPSRRTVETFLAGESVRRNSRNKSRKKSRREKVAATGD